MDHAIALDCGHEGARSDPEPVRPLFSFLPDARLAACPCCRPVRCRVYGPLIANSAMEMSRFMERTYPAPRDFNASVYLGDLNSELPAYAFQVL